MELPKSNRSLYVSSPARKNLSGFLSSLSLKTTLYRVHVPFPSIFLLDSNFFSKSAGINHLLGRLLMRNAIGKIIVGTPDIAKLAAHGKNFLYSLSLSPLRIINASLNCFTPWGRNNMYGN